MRPKVIVAMGATAALALTGNGTDILARRGGLEQTSDGAPVLITTHPAHLLRIPDLAARDAQQALFIQDLRRAVSLTA